MNTKVLAILAGGYGRRASNFTNGEHKSLIKLPNQTTIITRLINQARHCGIKKVYMVHFIPPPAKLIETVTKCISKLDMELVLLGQDPAKHYGTMYALKLVCSNVKEDTVIVFEGDVIISNNVAKKIFTNSKTGFFIDNKNKADLESMKVKLIGNSIVRFGKDILNQPEFCGILTFNKKLRNQFLLESDKVSIDNPFYEFVFNLLAKSRIRLPYFIIPESQWNEVDDENDYQEMINKYLTWDE